MALSLKSMHGPIPFDGDKFWEDDRRVYLVLLPLAYHWQCQKEM